MLAVLGIAHPAHRPDFATLARLIERTPRFDAPVIECGVYRGMTLLGMAHLLRLRGEHVPIYACDSFAGFPEPTGEDARTDGSFHSYTRRGYYHTTSEETLARSARHLGFGEQIRLVKGFFEDTLPHLGVESFSLAHIDCDLYGSYKTCLEHLYPRVLPGGFMVFDDYQSETVYPGAKRAVDEFLADKPEKLETLDVPHRRWFIQKRVLGKEI
jgi:O-methyltransferase